MDAVYAAPRLVRLIWMKLDYYSLMAFVLLKSSPIHKPQMRQVARLNHVYTRIHA